MKIVIVASTLRAGAKRCTTVAREAEAAAQRIGGLPSPEGMPAEATAHLHAAMAQLRHSAAAAGRESQFLVARAQRGLLADGPFGSLLDLAGPQLLSPWAMPAAPKEREKEHHQGGLASFLHGAGDELAATAVGLVHGGAAMAGHAVDGDSPGALGPLLRHLGVPRPSDYIPYVGSRRKELDEAAGWAAHHPDQLALAVGKDLVAYDEHAKGEHARGAGHNVVGLLSLAVPWTKAKVGADAAKAADGARAAERAAAAARDGARSAQQKAHVDHVLATVRGPGESAAAYAARRAHAASELARTRAMAERAEERVDAKVQAAHDAAEHAAEARKEALHEASNVPRDAGARVLDDHDEAER